MIRRLCTAAALLAAIAVTCVPSAARAATWTAPEFERGFGGSGRTGVSAWGIQYNSVTDEILVGDLSANKILRYTRGGQLIATFATQQQPYSIAVDPRDGSVYTTGHTFTGSTGVSKYSKTGAYLYKVDGFGANWIATDSQGFVYAAQGGSVIWKYAFDDATGTGTTVGAFGGRGRYHGIAVDAAGNVYGADTTDNVVRKWRADGATLFEFGGGHKGFAGLRGLALDEARGVLYVGDAGQDEIEKFDLNGNYKAWWGGHGSGAGQFLDGTRQVAVDSEGAVWATDYGNFRFHRFSSWGGLIGTYPDPAQPYPLGAFGEVQDVAVNPANGDVWDAEIYGFRFQRFNATGTPIAGFGERLDDGDGPYAMNYPQGISVDPATSNVWVSSTHHSKIRIYDSQGLPKNDELASTGAMDVDFYGGKAYVGLRNWDNYIRVYNSAAPHELVQSLGPFPGVGILSVAVDPATGRIYVGAEIAKKVYVYDQSGTLLQTIGSGGGGAGQFQRIYDVDISGGVLYTSDYQLNRIQAFALDGAFLGSFGGSGNARNQFKKPAGISHDAAGALYVADSGNDRIQKFVPGLSAPTGDTVKAKITPQAPANNATVPGAPLQVTGTATDNVRLHGVDVAVQHLGNGKWWDAKTAAWVTTKTWNRAPTWGTPTALSYKFTFNGVDWGTKFTVQARARDAAGSYTTGQLRTITVATKTTTDAAAPDSSIDLPQLDSRTPIGGGNVTVAGGATDDSGVTSVQVGVRDRVTNKVWDAPTGSWVNGVIRWTAATLTSPGAKLTDWTWNFPETLAAGSGSYLIQARAFDAAGHEEPVKPFTRFTTFSTFSAYDGFGGGVRVARGDVDGDGIDEIVTGTGPGGGPRVRAFELDGTPIPGIDFLAFNAGFSGGVDVALGDVDGDGRDEIVTGQGADQSLVRVYESDGSLVPNGEFAPYPGFGGGVNVAAGDVDGDGRDDVVTGAGQGGGSHVRALSFASGSPTDIGQFFAYPDFYGGVDVAVGNVSGDATGEIITGSGPGRSARVRVFDRSGTPLDGEGFDAYIVEFTGGVRVTTANRDEDAYAEIVTGAGRHGGPHVRSFNADGTALAIDNFFTFDGSWTGGVDVGGSGLGYATATLNDRDVVNSYR